MKHHEINLWDSYWVRLTNDDMYGAESGADPIIHAEVVDVNVDPYVEVRDVASGEMFMVDPEQCFATEPEARAALSAPRADAEGGGE